KTELMGVFHHVSRHLSDRPKTRSIAWNIVQLRLYEQWQSNATSISLRADLGKVVQHSFVDYSWTADVDVLVQQTMAKRLAVYARGSGTVFGTDVTINNRGSQKGGRAEAGLRFLGAAGVAELFIGYERVIDADAFEMLPLSWAFAGFRISAH